MFKSLQGGADPVRAPVTTSPWRAMAAKTLHNASRLLVHLANRLQDGSATAHSDDAPALEFYADAGAPEGALYLNGELVGYLHGVQRL